LFSDPHKTHKHTVWQNVGLLNVKLVVHIVAVSRVKSLLMLYKKIIAVCSQIHTKHTNTLCGQNVELLNVKLAVHIVAVSRVKSLL